MERITCGSASAALGTANDGIVCASFHGVLSSRNAGALSARVLQAAAERGGVGVLAELNHALAAMPPLGPAHYGYIPPGLRDVPGALLVSAEQMPVFASIGPAAAERGAMRRAFLSRAEAEAWLREQAHSLAANRAWWSLRR
jgi:hypothetical protein